MNSTRQFTALAVSLTLAGVAAAQTTASPGAGERGTGSTAVTSPTGGAATTTSPAAATHELKAARLSKLRGVNIYDSNAKKIGEIEDLVIDPASGRVLHALVSVGGILGVGDKEYAVPTKQLRVFSRSAEDAVPVKVELAAAPDTLTPAKKLDKDSPYVMGSKLVGTDVNDSGGKQAGEVEDVIVDLQSGEARVALVEFDDSWSMKDKLFAFPITEMKRDKDGKNLALNVSKETLGQTPNIEKNRLDKIDLSGQPWMQAAGGGASGAPAAGAASSGSQPASGTGSDASTPAAAGSTPAAGGASAPAREKPAGGSTGAPATVK